jgi:hypothetical protein
VLDGGAGDLPLDGRGGVVVLVPLVDAHDSSEDGSKDLEESSEAPSPNASGDMMVLVPHVDTDISVSASGVEELVSGASSMSGTNIPRTEGFLRHLAGGSVLVTISPEKPRIRVVYDSDDMET